MSAGAARWPGCCSATRPGHPRRAHQPPRRRGRRLAGPAPDPVRRPSYVRAGRGHPRPVVPRRGLHEHVGGRTTASWTCYDGGYAAFVLAKAERQRGVGLGGPPAEPDAQGARLAAPRPAGPHVEAEVPDRRGHTLIEDEPEPRDRLELQRFATQRLGKDVIDLEDADLVRGERHAALAHHLAPRAGRPGRLVGVNGAGKTSVLRLLAGELEPTRGRVGSGRTVAGAPLPGADRARPRPTGCSTRSRRCSGSPSWRSADRGDHRVLDARAVRLHRRPA